MANMKGKNKMTNKMKWFHIYETGLVTVGDVIGNEQDVFDWIVETEGRSQSGLTCDDLNLDDYKNSDSSYKYYLPFGCDSYDVEITFKKNEDGLYVVDEIICSYDEETETESESDYFCYDNVSENDFKFKILSDE